VFTNLDFAHSFSKQGAWNEAELNSDSLFLVNVFTLWLIEKKAPFTYGSLPPWCALYNQCAPLYWRARPPHPRVRPSTSMRSPCTPVVPSPPAVRTLLTWVRTPLLVRVRALSPQTCVPPPCRHARPTPADVRTLSQKCTRPPPRRRARPTPLACAPPNSHVCPPQMGARPPQTCAPYPRRRACPLADVCALPAVVRTLPPSMRAPSSLVAEQDI
jgi:hypothetical protein